MGYSVKKKKRKKEKKGKYIGSKVATSTHVSNQKAYTNYD